MVVNERNQYFDNLKGFLIILVIIGNSLEFASPKVVNTHFFLLLLYLFHMPLFVFLSGYFSKLSKRTTNDKVKRILKLYVYAQIFYIVFNIFITKQYEIKLTMLMPQWTLWYLLSMIFWYIISDYVKNYKKWIIWSFAIAMLAGFDSSIGTMASVSRTIFFMPIFICGMAFKTEYIDILRRNKIKILIGLIGVIVILLYINEFTSVELLFEYTKYTWFFDKPWFPMFLRAFHYVGAVIIGMSIFAFMPRNMKVLSKLGRYSLIMYLTHSGIIKIFISFKLLKYNSILEVILSTIIILATLIAVTFSYVYIIDRINKKRTNVL